MILYLNFSTFIDYETTLKNFNFRWKLITTLPVRNDDIRETCKLTAAYQWVPNVNTGKSWRNLISIFMKAKIEG